MRQVLTAAVTAALITSCAATVTVDEHPFDKASSSEFAPTNERSRLPQGSGIVSFHNQAGSYDDDGRELAYKKIYELCSGSYRLDNTGVISSEKSYSTLTILYFTCA